MLAGIKGIRFWVAGQYLPNDKADIIMVKLTEQKLDMI